MRFAIVIAVIGAVVVGAATGTACNDHEEQTITYENGTSTTLTIMSDESEKGTLRPGESHSFQQIRRLTPDRVRAFDEAGTLVFDRTYTWEDLEDAGWRVVITDDPSATETAEPEASSHEGGTID